MHDADLRIFTAVLRASILSKQICASCSVACGSRWKVRPAVCSRARSNLNMQGSLRTLRARECPPHPSNHIHSNLYRADFVFQAHFAAAATQQVQGGQCSAPSWCATGRSTQSSPLPEARRRTQLQCYVLVLMSTSGVHQELLSSVNHNMICVCYVRCVCCACARWIALLWVVCAKQVTCTRYRVLHVTYSCDVRSTVRHCLCCKERNAACEWHCAPFRSILQLNGPLHMSRY